MFKSVQKVQALHVNVLSTTRHLTDEQICMIR